MSKRTQDAVVNGELRHFWLHRIAHLLRNLFLVRQVVADVGRVFQIQKADLICSNDFMVTIGRYASCIEIEAKDV